MDRVVVAAVAAVLAAVAAVLAAVPGFAQSQHGCSSLGVSQIQDWPKMVAEGHTSSVR